MSLWEEFSSHMVHHPISPVVFVPFCIGSFLIVVLEEGNPVPVPLVLQSL